MANLGALVGIIFLSTEIRQSTRIGTNAAETTVSECVMEVNQAAIEHADGWASVEPGTIQNPMNEHSNRGFYFCE